MKTESETNKKRALRRLVQYEALARDVNALIRTFLSPAPNRLTVEQQAALDNLVGTMMDLRK